MFLMGTRIWNYLMSQLQLSIFGHITALILLMTGCFRGLSDWHLPLWKEWIVSHVFVSQVKRFFLDLISTLFGIMFKDIIRLTLLANLNLKAASRCCVDGTELPHSLVWLSSSKIRVLYLSLITAKSFTCRVLVFISADSCSF